MSETLTRTPRRSGPARRVGDVIFSGTSRASALLILVILAGVAIFLTVEALPVFASESEEITGGQGFVSYVWPLVAGTVVASIIAMVVATPIAVGIALFVSHYASRRVGQTIGFVIDLLAAVPSVVFGMWGMQVFAPKLVPVFGWLEENLGFLPFFADGSATGRTLLTAALVLAVMILPIITSVSREVFVQTPRLHEEAALALGATKWEMIRTAVIPFGTPGVIGGTMLGLGRALGETMAVAIILSPGPFTWNLIGTGNKTIPAEIALNFPEAAGLRLSELIAAGLVLFALTLAVNLIARWIVDRRSEFSGAN
ncbi:phosphate ABC transporter permease subunit PstC [Ornithinimicrobium sp. F0845]|uniref:phosphate ABC transporter permease subunit PstC n=1 Tax=Ornithinimicrobium sp. F0845 TaxID=2926412 RepID=UPI001FF1C0C8|nr:phosphate ABC transporter permease subunit PstC [Ornithinimicrobium sp. F0845]MCK0110765.1 phosphate ABC transporter permease subunit PstC [Ornithinimicrobium sp. F0845]